MIAFLFEVEAPPKRKVCFDEIFEENEPIAINLKVNFSQQNFLRQLFVYLANTNGHIVSSKALTTLNEKELLSYNNKEDKELIICIDNQSDNLFYVEMDIKFGHNLSIVKNNPLKEEVEFIQSELSDIEMKIENSHNYMKNMKDFSIGIEESIDYFNTFFTIISIVMFIVTLGMVFVSSKYIKTQMNDKKVS